MGIKFARSIVAGIVGIIVLAVLVCVMIVIVDERCSKALDENDIVWDEIDPAVRAGITKR